MFLHPDEQALAVASLRNAWSDIGLPENEADKALAALGADLRAVVSTAVEREKGRKESLEADERSLRSELTSLAAALGEESALGASAGQPPLLAWRAVAAEAKRLRAARSERLAAREAAAGKLHSILVELSGGTPEEEATRSTLADSNEPAPDAPGGLTTALIERLQTRLVRLCPLCTRPPASSLCARPCASSQPHPPPATSCRRPANPTVPRASIASVLSALRLTRLSSCSACARPRRATPPLSSTVSRRVTRRVPRHAFLPVPLGHEAFLSTEFVWPASEIRLSSSRIRVNLYLTTYDPPAPAAVSLGATRKVLESLEARLDHLREEKGRRLYVLCQVSQTAAVVVVVVVVVVGVVVVAVAVAVAVRGQG